MELLKELFSVSNIFNSIVAGIITSIIIWSYFVIRNSKLKQENYTILFINIYNFLITLNIAGKSEDFLFPLMKRIQDKVDLFKSRDDLDMARMFDDLIADFKILKIKNEWIEKKITYSVNFLKDVNISLLDKDILSKLMDLIAESINLRAFEVNPVFAVEIDEEYQISKRSILNNQDNLHQKVDTINEEIAKLQKADINDEKDENISKLKTMKSELIDKANSSTKEILAGIITLSQNTLYDIRLYLSGRKRSMIEIKGELKEILSMFPRKIRDELDSLSSKDLSEYLELMAADPNLKERKDFVKKNVAEIFEK